MELARPLQAECAPRHDRIRVLVVSDVLLYREGLTASLKGEAGLEVIDAISGSGAIAQVQVLAPDIMLLDASLRDSLALAREVRCLTPGVRVVGFGVTWRREESWPARRPGSPALWARTARSRSW